MTQPRLLADFAAVPTPRERRRARAENRAAQLDMFAAPIDDDHQADEPTCPVCAGPHAEQQCPHGTAPTLALTMWHEGSRAVPARTLHLCTDPTCPIRGTDVDRRDGGHYHDPRECYPCRENKHAGCPNHKVGTQGIIGRPCTCTCDDVDDTNSPERVTQRRAMFTQLGWSTTP